ncbi:DNA cytosine methyltransferase [Acinetobacter sp. ANC 5600]|uniref:DNA cytosine methyltransferase n=1 Tax=Acinetobacter sp. ANC 5600 TaxID=1960940 RepID=UPI00099221F0|nr:DNA cytosine methyltransferase [Acinetobacter sp. ANC 5600]OOV83844.1 DNA cytosine methyltransferase [Acinetobacter sp. ANC 5600]
MKDQHDNLTIDWLEQNNTGGLNELALFAGAGGGILGSHLLGWNTVCAVERDAYAAQILAQRQNDGVLPPFPIWSDVCSFDGKPWRGIIDVISGGFPCQDISSAGKGAGIDGERSGLWAEMARIIDEVRPQYVFVENSPMLVSRGLTRVISDLAEMGYDAQWARFSASNFGAPHQRDRIWIVAHPKSIRLNTKGLSIGEKSQKPLLGIDCENVGYTKSTGRKQTWSSERGSKKWVSGPGKELSNSASIRLSGSRQSWFSSDPAENPKGEADRTFYECVGHIWGIESQLGRVANGVAHRVDRLKAIGNGQVPIVAKSAFEYLGGAA